MDKKNNIKSDKIKIAFFIPNLEMAGAERVTVNVLNCLNKNRYDPSIILAKKEGYFVKDLDKNIQVSDFKTYSYIKIFFKLVEFFKRDKPDIFVSVFPVFSILSIFAKIFSGSAAKTIIIEHRIFSGTGIYAKTFFGKIILTFLFPLLMKVLYKNSSAIICVSIGVADDMLKITGLKDRIKVIYNPVIDAKVYSLACEPINYPSILGNDAIILAVGRLVEAKDYPNLLNAFSLVNNYKKVRLLILGDGKELKKLTGLSNSLGIAEKVEFLGFQINPYKFMSKADVFVLSSLYEGFGNVIVEAMACGTPVVSTDCKSGPNEIIEDGKNGLLVPVQNPKALAEAILKLLNSKELREKFSEAGKKHAEDFTIERKTKEYEKLFEDVLSV